MATESEDCVDELLATKRRVDELLERLTLDKSKVLISEARSLVETSQLFIENNKTLIPSYIMKKVSESLKRLEKQIETSNKGSTPFTFKAKAVTSKSSDKEPSKNQLTKDSESSKRKNSELQGTFFGFRGRNNEELQMQPDEVASKDVSLVDLSQCSVKIIGMANTLYIRDLKKTTVIVCLACRAISIQNCSECTFSFVCQQLRIDSTTDSTFSIFTSARSMLESSRGLVFKELNLNELTKSEAIDHDLLLEHLRKANFNESQNNWRCIDDFDWLSPTSASVNYKICE